MSFPSQGYIPTTVPIPIIKDTIAALARAVNQEWFASDTTPTVPSENGGMLTIVFVFSKRAIIEVTYDSGVTWFKLMNGLKIEAETLNSFELPVISTDQINFRADTAGDVRIARVLEVSIA